MKICSITRPLAGLAALSMLAACGEREASAPPSSQPENPAQASSPAAVQTATREDVAEALRCWATLSGAMAGRVVGGDGGAVVGIREQTRWLVEADRRSKAAGLTKDEYKAMMAEARGKTINPDQIAADTDVLNRCLETLP